MRDEFRVNAERLAAEVGLEIEFTRKRRALRKEDRLQQMLAERGDHPGLVRIFSAMETCSSDRPWHDKANGKTFFKSISGECLHYYFNGHGRLARQLTQAGIAFDTADNTLADPVEAQRLADGLDATVLHRRIEDWARHFFTVLRHFRSGVHWSFMQVEYATYGVFRCQATFQPLCEAIGRIAVQVINVEHVAIFLGDKLTAHYQWDGGNDFSTRIRHHMGPASFKLQALRRIGRLRRVHRPEVSFFKHYRHVEQRNGARVVQARSYA